MGSSIKSMFGKNSGAVSSNSSSPPTPLSRAANLCVAPARMPSSPNAPWWWPFHLRRAVQAFLRAECGSDVQAFQGPGTVVLHLRLAIHHFIRARFPSWHLLAKAPDTAVEMHGVSSGRWVAVLVTDAQPCPWQMAQTDLPGELSTLAAAGASEHTTSRSSPPTLP